MPWAGKVIHHAHRVCETEHSFCAASGGDSGGACICINRDGIRSTAHVFIPAHHRWQVQTLAVFRQQRHANITRGIAHHKSYELRCCKLRGENQVTLILTVLVVNYNYCLAGSDIRNRLLDGVQTNCAI